MTECILIEVGNDNRAVIIVDADTAEGEVRTTQRLRWIDHVHFEFEAGKKIYSFSEA